MSSPHAAPRSALGSALLCSALVFALVVRARSVPTPLPSTAPDTAFSAARALSHAPGIASRPHPSGSAAHAEVRAYLKAQLTQLGLEPVEQQATAVSTRYPSAGHVHNVMARLTGARSNGKAVVLMAHYDGVWASPAASDDGHGVMTALEVMRALRAGPPLANDVIVLFTDAEEGGLLGAAAFVREHPWARDVEAVLNVEARGTEGRAFMFETGANNLDIVRVLSTVDDVTAGSLLVSIYRLLPNDTDLTELAPMGKPMLNFAFVGGVSRYHTAHDDVAHLSRGSVQHVGQQVLALARALGNGPLPRPVTGDAVFFDLPFVGLVVYPMTGATVLSVLVALLVAAVLVVTVRGREGWMGGVAVGLLGLPVLAVVTGFALGHGAAGIERLHERLSWHGNPAWRGQYALALALLALTAAFGAWVLARRRFSAASLQAGTLAAWGVLAVLLGFALPGASYLLGWPTAAVSLAALLAREEAWWIRAVSWVATAVACAFLVGTISATGGYTLPLDGQGGIAAGTLVVLLAWLLAPRLEEWRGIGDKRAVLVVLALAVGATGFGMATVRRSDAHPTLANVTLWRSAEHDTAWLSMWNRRATPGSWGADVLGSSRRTLEPRGTVEPALLWLHDAGADDYSAIAAVPGLGSVADDAPDAVVVADTVLGERRRMQVRITPSRGALGMVVRGATHVRAVAVDGRAIDTMRFRFNPPALRLPFVAPPDSGFVLTLELPRDSSLTLRLSAATPGVPALPGRVMPARPATVVKVQGGDETIRFRMRRLR